MKSSQHRRRVVSRNSKGGYITYEENGLMNGSAPRRGGFETKARIKGKAKKDDTYIQELDRIKKKLINDLEEVSKKLR